MDTPDTTIVVLSHNNKNITEKFIELLFANTRAFRLIMIDNGSSDGTSEYLTQVLENKSSSSNTEKYITLVLNKENLGVIGGRNMGFALYQNEPTDYLCFWTMINLFIRAGLSSTKIL
jgi:GT2 family glycosyltransferase